MGMRYETQHRVKDKAPVDFNAIRYLITRSTRRFTDIRRVVVLVTGITLGTIAGKRLLVRLTDALSFMPNNYEAVAVYTAIGLFILTGIFYYMAVMTTWLKSSAYRRRFVRIGLTNRAKQTPVLISMKKNNGVYMMEYYVAGIPLAMVQDKKDEIESVLNLHVKNIRQGRNKNLILITATKGVTLIPDYIAWDDKYMRKNDHEIILGINSFGEEILDLSVTPHVQCGGITGSGKTVLLKNVLYQMRKKGAKIYLADFKGVDFTYRERELYHFVSDKEELLGLLEKIIEEMARRKTVLRSTSAESIEKYNERYPESKLDRIMLASDEIAYAFQKKGLKGHDKEVVERIERSMELIAQQGRAFGIHLWLSTQRGDADTIPPQIRSNLTFRICGRASELLSRVTIDSPAASQISSSLRGRFVDENEVFFQAFDFKEEFENG